MKKIDAARWGYDIDTSGPSGVVSKPVFCKASAKDAVGNLGIKMWEYEDMEALNPVSVPSETSPGTIKDKTQQIPAGESKEKKSPQALMEALPAYAGTRVPVQASAPKIVWAFQTSSTVNVGEKINIQGHFEPKTDKSTPLNLTITAPDGTVYVSHTSTSPDGSFEFQLPLNSEGEWKILADWDGNKSEPLKVQAVSEKSKKDTSGRVGGLFKKNKIIVGILFLYILILGLRRG